MSTGRRRRDVRPFVWGAGGALFIGATGMAWADAALGGLVVLVAALVVLVVRTAVRLDDPAVRWPRSRPPDPDGARREVNALTWTFVGSRGVVSEEAVRRLRVDAGRRLARRGVVLPGGLNSATPATAGAADAARARALLGDRVWAILTSPGGRMPTLADVARCVDAIERLDAPALPARPTLPEHPSEGLSP
jgi:hypothetical protein